MNLSEIIKFQYSFREQHREMIIPTKYFNFTEGKTVVVNVSKMDIPNKRKMKKLAKKIVRILEGKHESKSPR